MPSSDEYQNEAPGGRGFVPNSVWSSTTPAGVEQELTLPSGQTCLAKKMSIEGVVATGLLNEVDILTQMVDKHTRMVKGGKGVADGVQVDNSLLKDPEALGAVMGLTDRLIPHIVISPAIRRHWTETTVGKTKVTKMIPIKDREPGVVYTDQIDLHDKMHLFEWSLGGLTEFSSFRRESDSSVGTVDPVTASKNSSKRRARHR